MYSSNAMVQKGALFKHSDVIIIVIDPWIDAQYQFTFDETVYLEILICFAHADLYIMERDN